MQQSPAPSERRHPVLWLVSVFFVGLFLLHLVTPNRSFSELENKALTQRPALPSRLSVQSLNGWFSGWTAYVKDQIAGRDDWIALQSACETLVLRKQESGGILLGSDGMEFSRTYGLTASEQRTLPKNTGALRSLCQRYPGRVTALIVPAAASVYPHRLPAGAPVLDEAAQLEKLQAAVEDAGGRFLPLLPLLQGYRSEYIYYRTDHHWTSLGAYYAYRDYCFALGRQPFARESHVLESVEGFYGTHYSKSRDPHVRPDTLSYYDLHSLLTIYTVTGDARLTTAEVTGLYDLTKLDTHDKYAAFLHGNNGISRVTGEGSGKILVVKDSFANCFVPYLTTNFAQIDVVDFRNYNYGLDKLIAAEDYNQILVLYSFDSFKSDPYFYRAGVSG